MISHMETIIWADYLFFRLPICVSASSSCCTRTLCVCSPHVHDDDGYPSTRLHLSSFPPNPVPPFSCLPPHQSPTSLSHPCAPTNPPKSWFHFTMNRSYQVIHLLLVPHSRM